MRRIFFFFSFIISIIFVVQPFHDLPLFSVTTRPPVTASPLDERRGEVPTRSFFDLPRLEAYFPYVGGKRRGRQQSLSPRGEQLLFSQPLPSVQMVQAIQCSDPTCVI